MTAIAVIVVTLWASAVLGFVIGVLNLRYAWSDLRSATQNQIVAIVAKGIVIKTLLHLALQGIILSLLAVPAPADRSARWWQVFRLCTGILLSLGVASLSFHELVQRILVKRAVEVEKS